MAAPLPLGTQLLGSPLHVAGQCLPHGDKVGDALAKAPAADDLLLGLGLLLQLGAGDPPQLLHCALDHHAILSTQALGVGRHQISYCVDALFVELGGQLAPYPPDFLNRGDGHQLGAAPLITQIHHAAGGRPLLGGIVRQLGQGLSRRNAHPDGETCPLLHTFADLAAIGQ
ncbi:hypothetical protein D3C75_660940 [compost metagenome]